MASLVERTFLEERVERYLRGLGRVPGWLDATDARLVRAVAGVQTDHGTTGAVAEIGVFEAKLFNLLMLLAHDGESALAIDLFDQQDLNVDRSGHGASEERFRASVARFVGGGPPLHVLAASSEEVSATMVRDRVGPVRLFSVDGGHTAALTANDLAIADGSIADDGVVILDDVFNPKYPGVSDGLFQYVSGAGVDLRPFAISVNKVFLSRAAVGERYRRGLRGAAGELADRDEEYLGATVTIFRRLRVRESFTRSPQWQTVRDRRGVRALRGAFRRLPVHRARHRV